MKALFCPHLFDGHALHKDVLLRIDSGQIVAVEPMRTAPAGVASLPADSIAAPGLIDIQVNGGGGALLNETPTVEGVRTIAAAHLGCGTTGLLPTLITDHRAVAATAIAAVRTAMTDMPNVLGIHLEGPFLSPKRPGTHDPARLARFGACDGGIAADVARFTALGQAGVTLITLAPEEVPEGVVAALTAAGARVFAGHSDACFDQIMAAHAEGLAGATHLYNAMSQIGPREAGVVGAVLLNGDLTAGLILDNHHVAPASVALIRATRGFANIALVSDAMTPAGTDMTAFTLQGNTIRVENGRCVNPAGALAGAAITLSDAVRIGIGCYGLSAEEALASATRIPAECLGLSDRGIIAAGSRADLVVFDAGWRPAATMLGGRWISQPRITGEGNA